VSAGPVGDAASRVVRAERSRVRLGGGTARRALVALLAVGLFLTLGLPRWLQHDSGPTAASPAATFAKTCLAHGGTLAPPAAVGGQRRCTVTYGGEVYLMDAITPTGFDQDTAAFQRQGCEQARSEEASVAPAHRRVFVYHPATGVCEHRP
jgi:hypothetical protein